MGNNVIASRCWEIHFRLRLSPFFFQKAALVFAVKALRSSLWTSLQSSFPGTATGGAQNQSGVKPCCRTVLKRTNIVLQGQQTSQFPCVRLRGSLWRSCNPAAALLGFFFCACGPLGVRPPSVRSWCRFQISRTFQGKASRQAFRSVDRTEQLKWFTGQPPHCKIIYSQMKQASEVASIRQSNRTGNHRLFSFARNLSHENIVGPITNRILVPSTWAQ